MNELKKCPFCGGKAMFSGGNSWIVCEDCLAESGFFDYKHDAIKAWNNRKPLERVIERLEEAYDKAHEKYMNDYDLISLGRKYGLEVAIEIIKEEVG